MDNFNFDEKEKKSWIKHFFESFKRILHISSNRGNKPLNETLSEIGESEEEKALIMEQCEEIDAFHSSIKEFEAAQKKDPELTEEEWLSEEIEKDAQEIAQKLENRNLTTEELKELRERVLQAIDAEIETEAKGLENDIESIEKLSNHRNEED